MMTTQTTFLAPPWEENMNAEQLEAIRHQDGPCALMANAGSGKTRALVHRIARMVSEGTDPRRILAVTFSRKAMEEMNERLEKLHIETARVGTWHSLCLQILQEGQTPWAKWEVDSGGAADILLKEALGHKFLDWKDHDLGEVKRYLGACKANLFEPGSEGARKFAGRGHRGEMLGKTYTLHQHLVEERGILVFDDFLLFAHRWLSVEENRREWAGHWDYLLQDEAQDENHAQEVIAEMLAREHRNYMVVGDVAQSIYGFRGSAPDHLAGFAETWGAKTIYMNRNYRSAGMIVLAANEVIRPALIKSPVDMIAERKELGEVRCELSEDPEEEGNALAALVEETLQAGGSYEDVTALYRTNAQSRALEEALLKKRIPYVVVGGVSFYQRKEVRDLLAYLRVAVGRDPDGKAVRRCINAPFRYLGKAFIERLEDAFDRAERTAERTAEVVSVLECAKVAVEGPGIQGRQRESVFEWVALIEALQEQHIIGGSPGSALLWLIDRTQYLQWLNRDQGEESIESSHVANVRELIRIAERFDDIPSLIDYIDETEKAAARQRRQGAGGARVLLMTIHRSKGLEWPSVFVAGCNEDRLPHYKGDLEEERRLMYVAMTRARDTLVLSYVRRFAKKEGVRDALPSRFLADAGLLKKEASHGGVLDEESQQP